MIPVDLQQLLEAGGNISMIAVALGFWKIDRRVYRIELKLWPDRRAKRGKTK